jgi:hypothetical protein
MSLVDVCVVIPVFYFPGLSQRGAVNLSVSHLLL